MKQRARRFGGGFLAFLALTLGAKACADLTAPGGVVDVTIDYDEQHAVFPRSGTPGWDTIHVGGPPPTRIDSLPTVVVTVGTRFAPPFRVMIGSSTEQPNARYAYTIGRNSTLSFAKGRPANGSTDSTIVKDTIVVDRPGRDFVIATLVGATVGGDPNPGAKLVDTVMIISRAAANVINRKGALGTDIKGTIIPVNAIGTTETLVARALGAGGATITNTPVTWTSLDPTIVSIDTLFSGKEDGEVRVRADSNGTGRVRATLAGVDVVDITFNVQQTFGDWQIATVLPQLTFTSKTQTAQLTAVPRDANNTLFKAGANLSTVPTLRWVSTAPSVVFVDEATGMMTARENTPTGGALTQLTARNAADEVKSNVLLIDVNQAAVSIAASIDTLRINSRGQTLPVDGFITATALDALGQPLPSSRFNWQSLNSGIASVNVTAGAAKITGENVGSAKVKVEVAGTGSTVQTDTVFVFVTNDPTRIDFAPDTIKFTSIGDVKSFTTLLARNAANDTVSVPRVVTSLAPSIASVAADNSITAVAVGDTALIVTAGPVTQRVPVRVRNFPSTLVIADATLSLNAIGASNGTFPVDFKNNRGDVLPRNSATWVTRDASKVSVSGNNDGTITATGVGSTWIVAINPGDPTIADSVEVTVTDLATTVAVSAPAVMTAFGSTQTLTATATNARGNTPVLTQIRWTAPDSSIVVVDSITGVIRAKNNGTVTVTATDRTSGIAGTRSVTVAQAVSNSRSVIVPETSPVTANGSTVTKIRVQLRDANDSAYTRGVLTNNPTLATTLGTVTQPADSGGGLWVGFITAPATSGTANISGTVNALTIGNPGAIVYTAAPASKYLVTTTSTNPTVGTQVTISAQLADANNNPVLTAGQVVTWSATGGGSFASPTSTTNASGIATVQFTVASSVGATHIVTGTTGSNTGSSPSIAPIAAAASQYIVTSASATPAAGSGVVITAQLADASGNAVATAGQTVTWTKSDGNGSFSAGTSNTNASGVATITLNTHTVAGTATTVTATTGALTGTSSTITTAAGAAAQLTVTTAPAASPQSGIPFPQQPVLQLRDANGNVVNTPNVSVTVTTSGGTLGGTTTVQTNGSGVASFVGSNLALSGSTGARTLTFSASGVTSASANITVVAGTAANIAVNGTPSTAGTVGQNVTTPPSVTVTDASGNPVGAFNVTFTLTAGGGSIAGGSPAVVATNGSGVATLGSWTLGTTAGTNNNTVTATGTGLSTLTFNASANPGTATTITANSATAQSATVFTNVAAPPSVTITDGSGNPVANFPVTFTLTATGGTGGAISPATPATVNTNSSGVATLAFWTLGQTAGTNNNTVTATGTGLATITFNATGTASSAASIVSNSVTSQSATVNTAATAPSVLVRDSYGNAVSGVAVTFTVMGGGGTLTAPTTGNSITTNASGVATVGSWSLGTAAGTNTVDATVASATLVGEPVTFTATGTPGAANNVVTNSVTTQSAIVGTNVTTPPSVIVRDQFNNPVAAGVSVTFSVTAGSGLVNGGASANVNTNASGVATLTSWQLGSSNGTNTVQVTVGNTVSFDATGTAGTATQITVNGTPSTSATVNTNVATPPSVLIRDASNNPVSGFAVTFTVTQTGGTGGTINSGSPAVVVTNSSGIASLTSWTLGQTAGTNNNTVTATGTGLSTLTFNASGTPGAANNLVANSVTTQSATVSTNVSAPPSVIVRDQFNNPVGAGTAVTFTVTQAATGGVTVPASGNTVNTNASGVATLTSWTLGSAAGTNNNTVTAEIPSVTNTITFNASGTAGTATQITVNGTPSTSATVGTAVASPPSVLIRDASNNPVSGFAVTFTLTQSGGTGGAIAPVTPAVVLTNSSGIATLTSWTLGQTAGTDNNTVTATGTGLGTLTFNASGTAGAAQNIVATTSMSQSGVTAGGAAAAPGVRVRDSYNNAVSGVSVTFAVAASSGTINGGTANVPINTDANGNANLTTWTTNSTVGTNTVTASVAGLTGSPVTFTATTVAGTATQIASNSSTSQSATIGTAVSAPPSVLVRDVNNNPVAGVSVTFTVTAAQTGGLVNGAANVDVSTNSSGIATLTSWTLGTAAGTNTVEATVGSLALTGEPVTFNATGTAGTATQITVNGTPSTSATVNTTVATPPSVLIRDASNNPVAGFSVTFTLTASGGTGGSINSGSPAVVVTNSSGIATLSSWTLGQTAGTNNNTVTATGAGLSTLTFNASGTPGAANNLIANSVTSQTATVSSPVSAPPSVIVRDQFNNPLGAGTAVTFTVTQAATGGVTVPASGNTVNTNASGVATLTSWTLGSAAGTNNNTVTAEIPSVTNTITFNASGTAGTATQITVNGTPTTSATVGTAVASPPSVLIRDASNNPVANFAVTFTLTQTGGSGGSIAPVTPAVVMTNSSGIASLTSWTLGQTAGTDNNTVTATGTGLGTLTFNVSGTAGAATSIIVNGTPSTSGTAGATVTTPPSVLVRDAFNNPVAGVNVQFDVTAGGGSITAPTSGNEIATDANGIATIGSWTLGTTAGTNTVVATVDNVTLTGEPVTFNATGIAGTADATTTQITASPISIIAGVSTSTITVQARDANNNNLTVSGGAVVLNSTAAGSLSAVTNNNNGTYTATLTGVSNGTATITGTIGGNAITDDATVTVQAATQYLVTAASTSVQAGTSVLITAQLKDAGNNNVAQSGKTVVWSKTCNAGACAGDATGGSFATPTSLTDANGQATVALTVSTNAAISHVVTATDNTSLTGSTGTIDVIAAAPSTLAFTTQPPATVQANGAFGTTVTVRDAFGNAVTTDPNGSATEQVSLALTTPAGATLGGTSTVNVNWTTGEAVFSGLTVDLANSYTLTASSVSFSVSNAVSNSFTVLSTTAAITDPATATEATLDGETITVTLTNGVYDATLNASDFSLTTAIPNLTITGVVRNSDTEAVLTLDHPTDGSGDFDVTRTIAVNVLAGALATGTPATTATIDATATAASTVVITGPATREANQVGTYTLESREANGSRMRVGGVAEVFALSQTVGTGTATFSGATATIAANDSTTTFTYRNDTPEGTAKTIQASDAGSGVEGIALGDATLNVTILTTTATISGSTNLDETNLNSGTLTIQITNGTFIATPLVGQFTLNTAPAGVTVAGVTRDSDTQVTLDLDFNGTDFDVTANGSVTVGTAALATGAALGGGAVTTGNTAAFTPAAASSIQLTGSLAIATNTPTQYTVTAYEPNASTMTVAVNEPLDLTNHAGGGTPVFSSDAAGLTPITAVTLASGQSVATFYYKNSTAGTYTIRATDDAASEGTALGFAELANIVVTATTAAITDPGATTEATLDGETITVTLTNGVYDATLNAADFSLTTAIPNLTITGVVRNSDTEAVLTLDHPTDGSGDFDATTTIAVNVLAGALATGTPATTATINATATAASTVVVTGPTTREANQDGTYTLTAKETNGTNMVVGGVDEVFALNQTAGTGTPTFSGATVTITGGTESQTFTFRNDTPAAAVKTITVSDAGSGTEGFAFPDATYDVTILTTTATISGSTNLDETNLNSGTLTVQLTNGTFIATPLAGQFTLNTAPAGVTVAGVTRDSDTQVTLDLDFNGTDFDVTANGSVTVGTAALATGAALGGGAVTTGNTAAFTPAAASSIQLTGSLAIATNTPTQYTVTAYEPNASTMTVAVNEPLDLTNHAGGGTPVFSSDAAGLTPITAVTLASGQSVATFYYKNSTAGTYTIRATDDAASEGTALGFAELANIVVTATTAAITDPAAATEATLDGETITVTLTNGVYDATLNAADFSLTTAIPNLTITGVVRNSDTEAVLTLDHPTDGSGDFDATTTIAVNVLAGALATGTPATTATIDATATAASTVVVTGPTTREANQDGTYTLTAKETNGTNMVVGGVDEVFALNQTAGTGTPTFSGATVTITGGTESQTFTFRNDTPAAAVKTITVSDAGSGTEGFAFPDATYDVTILTTTATISGSTNLDETNLNSGTLTVQLTNGTFIATPLAGQFTLNTAPAGVTVAGVTRDSDTQVTLDLDFNGTDFDVTANGSVTVGTAALATGAALGGGAVTTGNTAAFTPAAANSIQLTGSLAIATNTPTQYTVTAYEPNASTMTVAVNEPLDLTNHAGGGTPVFSSDAAGLTPITAVTLASGQSVATFYYKNSTAGTYTIRATDDAASEGTALGFAELANIVVTATTAAITDPAAATEATLDGETITVTLTNGVYDATLNAADFSLTTAIPNLTITGVVRNSDTEAVLTLDHPTDGSGDFDATTTIAVNVLAGALATGTPATTATINATATAASTVVVTGPATREANQDGTYTLTAKETNGTNMVVGGVDEVFALNQTAGTGTPTFSGATVTITGGTESQTFTFRNDTPAAAVKTITVSDAGSGTEGFAFPDATYDVTILTTTATISGSTNLDEANLNSGTLTVQLTNGTFIATPLAGQFTLNTAPAGVTVAGVTRDSDTQVTLDLDFNGTDFDVTANGSVTVGTAALATGAALGGGAVTTGNTAAFTPAAANSIQLTGSLAIATNTPTQYTVTAYEPNASTMTVAVNEPLDLTNHAGGGTPVFSSDAAGLTPITAVTLASGQSVATFYYKNSTAGTYTIRATDDAASEGTALGFAELANIVVTATTAAITDPAATTEATLDGETITVTLTNGVYDATLNAADFSLTTAIPNLTITGVVRNSDTEAVLTLDHPTDGSGDFDATTTIAVNVLAGALATGTPATTATIDATATAASTVVVTGPATREANQVGTYTLESREANGSRMRVGGVAEAFALSQTAGTGTATFSGATATIAANDSTTTFTYRNDTPEGTAKTIQASDAGSGVEGIALGDATLNVTILTTTATISGSTNLDETNLNSGTLTIQITNGTFIATPLVGQFTLNNVPAGVTIASVDRDNATQVTLNLDFSGTDFDVTANVDVEIATAALATGAALGGGNVTTGNTAAFTPAAANSIQLTGSLAIATNTPTQYTVTAYEPNASTMTVAVNEPLDLTNHAGGGTPVFSSDAAGLTPITAVTLASGQSVATFYYKNSTAGTYTIRATDDAASEGTALGFAELANIVVTATTAAITDPAATTEATLDGETITVTLTNGVYDATLNNSDFTLNTTIPTLAISGVTRDNATTATLTLSHTTTGAGDFDATATISVTVTAAALATGTAATTATIDATATAASTVVVTGPTTREANQDGTYTLTAKETNGTNMVVGGVDEVFALNQTAGTGTPTFSGATVTITGGTESQTFTFRNDTPAAAVKTITVSDAGSGTEGFAFPDATYDVTILTTTATISGSTNLDEANLNSGTLTVQLTNGTFIATPLAGQFTLNTAPAGVTVAGVTRDSDTQVTLDLDFNGTDFDVTANGSVTVGTAALATGAALGGGAVTTGNTAAFTPTAASSVNLTGPASVTAGAISGLFTLEARETNGTSMVVNGAHVFTLTADGSGTREFYNTSDTPLNPDEVTIADGTASVQFKFSDTEASNTRSVTATYATGNVNLGNDSHTIDVNPDVLDNFLLTLSDPQASGVAFANAPNTLTARDQFNNTITDFDASSNNVTINNDQGGTITGLGSGNNNVLNQAGDFVSGVANFTGVLVYTGSTVLTQFSATSANAKVSNNVTITIN